MLQPEWLSLGCVVLGAPRRSISGPTSIRRPFAVRCSKDSVARSHLNNEPRTTNSRLAICWLDIYDATALDGGKWCSCQWSLTNLRRQWLTSHCLGSAVCRSFARRASEFSSRRPFLKARSKLLPSKGFRDPRMQNQGVAVIPLPMVRYLMLV